MFVLERAGFFLELKNCACMFTSFVVLNFILFASYYFLCGIIADILFDLSIMSQNNIKNRMLQKALSQQEKKSYNSFLLTCRLLNFFLYKPDFSEANLSSYA